MNFRKKINFFSLVLIFSGSLISFNANGIGLETLLGGSKSHKYKNIKDAAKQGLNRSVADNVKKISDIFLGVVPGTFKTSWAALNIYFSKFIFGTRVLDSKRLDLMKDHIYKAISPYLDRHCLRDLSANDTLEGFIAKKEDVVNQLRHVSELFIKSLLVYNYDYYKMLNPSALDIKAKFMSLYSSLSLIDNDEISFHITHSIKYLNQIINIFNESKSTQDLLDRHADINYWMLNIKKTFSHINNLININSSFSGDKLNTDLLNLLRNKNQ